jgi:hypothetical protein
MNLEDYKEPLAYDAAFWLAGLHNPDYPIEQLGRLALEVSEKLRSLAIMALLTAGNSDLFYHNLDRAGRAWECFLRQVHRKQAFAEHHWCCGRYLPLMDTIAAADFDLARRLAELAPREFREEHEYEDDFTYAQMLHRLAGLIGSEGELLPLLHALEGLIGDEQKPRFEICQALVQHDQTIFDTAFADLLRGRAREIAESKARGQLEEPCVAAQRSVYIEGLALLRLAERRGLRTETEYSYCPSLARVPMRTPFPDE